MEWITGSLSIGTVGQLRRIKHAITSATPTGDFILNTVVKDIGKIVVYLEINQSYDYNNYYSEAALGDAGLERADRSFSGQPAVVYSVTIDTNKPAEQYTMKLVGHSDPTGESEELFSDVSRLDTALKVIDTVKITMKE